MEIAEMCVTIQDVVRDVFDSDDLTITPETEFGDVEGWDSFSKINLFSSLEKEFSVKFTIADIEKMKNVAAIIDVIRGKA